MFVRPSKHIRLRSPQLQAASQDTLCHCYTTIKQVAAAGGCSHGCAVGEWLIVRLTTAVAVLEYIAHAMLSQRVPRDIRNQVVNGRSCQHAPLVYTCQHWRACMHACMPDTTMR